MTASDGNAENNPNMCVGLKIGMSSISMRFWSVVPPLTFTPFEASPTLEIPGSICKPFKISVSPKAVGSFSSDFKFSVLTPITGLLIFSLPFPDTKSSSRLFSTLKSLISKLVKGSFMVLLKGT